MAMARKCDRCGKYYDRNIRHTGRFGSQDYPIIGCFYALGTSNPMCGEGFDLCDDCIDELKIFLGIKEEEK